MFDSSLFFFFVFAWFFFVVPHWLFQDEEIIGMAKPGREPG